MKNNKLIVIGGDAAGMGAASKIRREQPDREIIVFEKGRFTSYAACGIPYYIAGMVKTHEDLIARKPEVFIKKQNIDVRTMHEVTEIDIHAKVVKGINHTSGDLFREKWDQLLIATGASAIVPEMQGAGAEGVFAMSTLQSGIGVFDFLKKYAPGKVVVAGGGYIGLEMAEAFLERGLDVSLVDMADQLMNSMDKEMAKIIADYMEKQGVRLFLGEKLDHFETDQSGKLIRLVTDSRSLDADMALLGLGVKPNAELAASAGIELGSGKAIRVNEKMETSVDGVWAAGDCAESFHLLDKKNVWIPLGTVANKHGLVAGVNISGGEMTFPGVLGTAITQFRDLEIARTG